MSSFLHKALLQIRSPSLQFKRFRGKINIQRPRLTHYERARMIAVTMPVYPEKKIESDCLLTPSLQRRDQTENQYEKIIAREVKNWLDHSQVVTIFHLNSIGQEELFKTRVKLHRQNVHYKVYSKSIMRHAVLGTRYEAILPLFESKCCILFSPENKLKQIIQITKKVPQMLMIAGIVENRFMSRNQLVEYTNLPDLTTLRAQFVSVLNLAGSSIVNNLESQQKNLVNILDTHVRVNGESKAEEGQGQDGDEKKIE